jgi:hypothetical protein
MYRRCEISGGGSCRQPDNYRRAQDRDSILHHGGRAIRSESLGQANPRGRASERASYGPEDPGYETGQQSTARCANRCT